MGPVAESSEDKLKPSSNYYSLDKALRILKETNPSIESLVQRAEQTRKIVEDTFEATLTATKSRLSQILLTSSSHSRQTIESLKDAKTEFDAYEEHFFRKLKEGTAIAVSNPVATTMGAVGLGFLVLRGPRRFIYNKTMSLFMSQQALLSRADAKLKELKQTSERFASEIGKIERNLSLAEEEFKRGKTKLRHAGNQIHKEALATYKYEREVRGLKDILGELPKRGASQLRSEVSQLHSEVKQTRKTLAKEVLKINNYGISV